MHNGAFVRLEDAIRYHLNAADGAATFNTSQLAPDLRGPTGPVQPLLDRLDPRLRTPVNLSGDEFGWLVDFVRNGLLDPSATSQHLRRLIPEKLPSGIPGLIYP